MGLQPLREVHLNAGKKGPRPESNPAYSDILLGISLLVLGIACVNFVTLAVGRSGTRAREVGVRKVVGASRGQVVKQFLGESVLLSGVALALGIALAELLLPAFNGLTGKDLSLHDQTDPAGWAFLLGLTVVVGLAAGGYPALVLSGFQPVAVLKGRFRVGKSSLFGRGLVVLQFALSIFLVVSALLMARQMEYLRTKPLGFARDHVLDIQTRSLEQQGAKLPAVYWNEVLRHHAVLGVTGTHSSLTDSGRFLFRMGQKGVERHVDVLFVSYDFLKTMKISLLEGRDFSSDRDRKRDAAILVNEALVRRFGWKPPVAGRVVPVEGRDVKVAGVVEDFHFQSLRHRIGPAVLMLSPRALSHLLVRIRPEDVPGTLAFLKTTWRKIAPHVPFHFAFLDAEIDRQYREEARWCRVVRDSALFAVFIACMGAFGLASLTAARRAKEIGIRKVLGASVPRILSLLSREFLALVGGASLLAWPAAYYAIAWWLRDFAYRIEPGMGTFVLGGGLTLAVVLFTVGFQAVKAARANPVDALRYE